MKQYVLGFDIGSSSVKAALIDVDTGALAASAVSPEQEMPIWTPKTGWAEQDPETWWEEMSKACRKLRSRLGVNTLPVKAIGLSYQEHGLIALDAQYKPLRPAIIWCDSRAVEIGNRAFQEIGREKCLTTILNSPGNFTASKLAWVKQFEPLLYEKIRKIALPGDYIGYRLTGVLTTTAEGLSEGMFYDFSAESVAKSILEYYGIDMDLFPALVPSFGDQGAVTEEAAHFLGITPGARLCFRAGDQHANAWGLGVLDAGDAAVNAGTSGVVFAIWDQPVSDPTSRVNTFLHVNHTKKAPRYSVVLCVNGAAILYRWLRKLLALSLTYEELNRKAAEAPIGSQALVVLPYGNGAERSLGGLNPGASVQGLNFNIHTLSHLSRACLEGVAFALRYGKEILQQIGMDIRYLKAGYANLFQSEVFSNTLASIYGCPIDLFQSDGAQAAARAAAFGAGWYRSVQEALAPVAHIKTYEPDDVNLEQYKEAYERWKSVLFATQRL